MKIVTKTKNKKQKIKKKPVLKSKKEHVVVVAQEIKFARLLSGNEKKTRDRALKTLKKWLLNCFEKGYEFKESDFTRIWKGLFYAVWMSDKPLVQEELCENIAGILDLFPADQLRPALLLAGVGFRALATEWYGLDHHRMDKCLMLVRRYLRGSLRCLRRCGWTADSCGMYADMLGGADGLLALKTPGYARNATSMVLHVLDCYLEELAKVSEGDIPGESVAALLRPLCAYLCGGEAPTVCAGARRVLTQLLRQSDLGLRYRDKTRAWHQMGCPEGGPDALELVSDGEDDDGEESEGSDAGGDGSEPALDPRAGRVDVLLPTLPVPAAELAAMLGEMLASATPKAHKRAKICLLRFQQLSNNEYPLREAAPPSEPAPAPRAARRAARALAALESELLAESDELALRGLSRKHRKRLVAASRAGADITAAAAAAGARAHRRADSAAPAHVACANGDWSVEETEPEAKKKKISNDSSNKENVIKNKKQNGDANAARKGKVNSKNKDSKHIVNNNNKIEKQLKNVGKLNKNAEMNIKTTASPRKDVQTNKKPAETNVKTQEEGKTEKNTSKNERAARAKQNDKYDRKIKNGPTVVVSKVKNYQKQLSPKSEKLSTPKKVKFVLKNNSMQEPVDYYKSVRQSPNIPFDSRKVPPKANLKPSTPSPINPFFKKKMKFKK